MDKNSGGLVVWHSRRGRYSGCVYAEAPTVIAVKAEDGGPVPEEVQADFIEEFTSQVTVDIGVDRAPSAAETSPYEQRPARPAS